MNVDSFDTKSEQFREKRREYLKEHRSSNRKCVFNDKRLHLSEVEEENRELTLDQVKELSNKWRKSKGDLRLLTQLKRTFGQGTLSIQTFLKVDGALGKLIGAFTGNDADLQLEAGACFVNLFLEEHGIIKRAVRDTVPYLMTYLSSSSLPLKELCLWALGNVAADCQVCCRSLKAQNFVQMVLGIIRLHCRSSKSADFGNDVDPILHSATFALVRYMSHMHDDWSKILASGLGECLPLLIGNASGEAILEEASIAAFYLSTRTEFTVFLLQSGCVERAIDSLRHLVDIYVLTSEQHIAFEERHARIVTLLVRTLAGACADADMDPVSDCWRTAATLVPRLLRCNYPHLQQETLWLLGNMTAAHFPWLLDCYVRENGLVADVVQMLVNPVCPLPGITLQCLTCLCNAVAVYGAAALGDHIRLHLSDDSLADLLGRPDPAERRLAITLLALLRLPTNDSLPALPSEPGHYAGSYERLLRLSISNEDDETRTLANAVLQHQ